MEVDAELGWHGMMVSLPTDLHSNGISRLNASQDEVVAETRREVAVDDDGQPMLAHRGTSPRDLQKMKFGFSGNEVLVIDISDGSR